MNILKELYNKKITEDEACQFIDTIFDKIKDDSYDSKLEEHKINLAAIFQMDEYEYTAYCQGAPLFVISKWRYEGWPQKSCNTKEPIDYKQYHWFVEEVKPDIWGLRKI